MIETLQNKKIAVVGLGYVGMPLAIALAKFNTVTGYDINIDRVEELKKGIDRNREVRQARLRATTCTFTHDMDDIEEAEIYIVTVPTPIDASNEPDLSIIRRASKDVGQVLKAGDIVVYESTVYPGVTEDVCGPILEQESKLKSGKDFFLGYSPERINPGDEEHTVENITKVVAAQTPEVTDLLAELYGQMNGGKIFKAKNIKTAEASKAIENAQRDINIAFVNEVTMLLNKMGISSHEVLEAAGTKWNFLPFRPGLVGGHCIGVDPYYLAKSALAHGHQPEVILAGRKINDSMGGYVAGRIVHFLKKLNKDNFEPARTSILILGFTFKENINDIRNTKVIDIINKLKEDGFDIDVHDPHALPEEAQKEYGISILSAMPQDKKYDCIALAVNHRTYSEMSAANIASLLKTDNGHKPVIYDVKGIWKNQKFPETAVYETL